jgi:Gas vesicle synthesis protein GvpL/GvpF
MLYLYAFSPHPTKLPRTPGIAEAAVAAESFDGIDAVVSVLEAVAVEPSEESVLAHARVVDELAASNDAVVPARFGRGFADRDSLRAAVLERLADLEAALERVRGCVELGLRVFAPAGHEAVTPASGREYMVGLLERSRRDERVAEELHAPLAAIAREATKSLRATPKLLLSAAYLVPRADVVRFREAVQAQQEEHVDLSLACTGPWPPYSFATAEGEEA